MDIQLTKGMIMLLVGSGGIVLTLLIAIINILVAKRKQRVFDEVSLDNKESGFTDGESREIENKEVGTMILEDESTVLLETQLLEEEENE